MLSVQLFLARKELGNFVRKDEVESERQSLEMIRLVKHPNIIELLATYKILDRHSLLFPLAQMDLKTFLKTKPTTPFDDKKYLFQSMRNLASALETIHNPFVCQLGYHRDIKPGNILLIENVFKISDFGLARFKPHTEGDSTKSQYRGGDNIYGAPDRIPPDGDEDNPKIGRKYDVWSLGCVFLELASFVARGPEGVEQFREKRLTKIQCVTDEMFYAEIQTPEGYLVDVKKEVLKWIVELKHDSEGELSLILDIVRRMLKGMPEERPTAEEVRRELEIILSQGIGIATSNSSPLSLNFRMLIFRSKKRGRRGQARAIKMCKRCSQQLEMGMSG